jgi:hypothetical protein
MANYLEGVRQGSAQCVAGKRTRRMSPYDMAQQTDD